jgi:hypothetical protein
MIQYKTDIVRCPNASQPDLQTLNKIAKVLNVNMKDLLADSKIE